MLSNGSLISFISHYSRPPFMCNCAYSYSIEDIASVRYILTTPSELFRLFLSPVVAAMTNCRS